MEIAAVADAFHVEVASHGGGPANINLLAAMPNAIYLESGSLTGDSMYRDGGLKEMIDGEVRWKESAVTHMQLKSFTARVSKDGTRHKVLGVILNDGTPIKSVEVKVDDGTWQPATIDPATNSKYSWKLFTYKIVYKM